MQKIGYARVSSKDQTLDVQLARLSECDKIFQEKVSGMNAQRKELEACLDYVREGDVLMVTRLDRLARSTLHLWKIIENLASKKVELVVLDQNIDTSTSSGRLLFSVLGAIAQFETEIRAERQKEGIEKALERGIKFGRSYKLSDDEKKELIAKRESGESIKSLMQRYQLSHKSVYNYLNTDKDISHTQSQ